MNPMMLAALLAVAPGAPLPKEPQPNPLSWAYMGVRVQSSLEGPLQISAPEAGTPAFKAGLKEGDVIIKLGPLEPRNFDDMIRFVFAQRPGTILDVTVKRGGETVTLPLRLAERPDLPDYSVPTFIQPPVDPNEVP